jgi:hypothetical protein
MDSSRQGQPELTGTLVSLRLGVPNPDRTWLALHPQLGAVYLSALADQIARANDIPAITDQPQAHGALNGWDTGTLARVPLSDDDSAPEPGRGAEEVSALYAAHTIQAVVPQGLADIPVEKIVQARRTRPRNSTRSRPTSTRWRTSSPGSRTSRTRRSCTQGSRSCSTGTCASPWHSWNAACARSAWNPAGPCWA